MAVGPAWARPSVARGVKIIAIVDRHGLPLAASTHAANHHEVTLVQPTFDFYMIEARPEKLIGDRAYDSDNLDAELVAEGIEMIAPHRRNRRKRRTQDGPRAAPLRAPLAGGALLRLARLPPPPAGALGVPSRELPRPPSPRLLNHPPQPILR